MLASTAPLRAAPSSMPRAVARPAGLTVEAKWKAVKLKTKKRPKKLTPSDKKHVGATYPALPPPPPAFTILKAGASN